MSVEHTVQEVVQVPPGQLLFVVQGFPALVPPTQTETAWHELLEPTQHEKLHDLPGTLWQQWLDVQSLFAPHPLQPGGIPDCAIALLGAAILVIRGPANAAVAPANAKRFMASRRERPSRTLSGTSSKPLASSWLTASWTSVSDTGVPSSDSMQAAISAALVSPSEWLNTAAASALRQWACLSSKSYITSSSPTRSMSRSFDLAIGARISIGPSIDFLEGMSPLVGNPSATDRENAQWRP